MISERFALALVAMLAVASGAGPAQAGDDLIDEVASLALLADTDLDAPLNAAAASGEPFREGTWTFQTYGSTVVGDSDHGYIHTAHIGVGYHFDDGLSINLEALGGWVDSKTDDDGGVGGLDLLFRWHFHQRPGWTLYLDGGAGFQQATTNFPSDSHHNFRPQIGLGATLDLFDTTRLMTGARWLHISNAGTSDDNDGLDAAQLYLGVMVPF